MTTSSEINNLRDEKKCEKCELRQNYGINYVILDVVCYGIFEKKCRKWRFFKEFNTL